MEKRGRKNQKNIQKKEKNIKIFLIIIRYLILLGLVFTLPLIYNIFTPLTVYPVFLLLKLVYNQVSLLINSSNIPIIIINNQLPPIEIVSACVAGSAYLLLLILNLAVPMRIGKRIRSILLSFSILLSINILRIFLLSVLYQSSAPFFDFTHKLFWYFLSTVFVIAIWFFIVKIFSIKEIPVYSDLSYITFNKINKKQK